MAMSEHRSAVSAELVGWTVYESPIGPLTLLAGPMGIRAVHFPGRAPRLAQAAKGPMPQALAQLQAYFAGERRCFDLDLELQGTPLQKIVWQRLLQIGYGKTTSYGELARSIDESAYPADVEPNMRARLVGAAVGRTPTPILVPCHRVIGADGSLTGYGGGLARKRALLELEGADIDQTARGVQKAVVQHPQLALL
jgi:methylated-DNA-[protein]-cysteine S-methyltransferase